MILSNDANITFDDVKVEGKGRHFVSRFIEAGGVSYGKAGVLKVTKETLDKFIQTLVGCPVIIRHKTLTSDNVDEERVGVVNGVWFDPKDAWFYCDGIIWKKDAIRKIENGWTVSCTYEMTDSTGEGGEWHNIPFEDELLNGVFFIWLSFLILVMKMPRLNLTLKIGKTTCCSNYLAEKNPKF